MAASEIKLVAWTVRRWLYRYYRVLKSHVHGDDQQARGPTRGFEQFLLVHVETFQLIYPAWLLNDKWRSGPIDELVPCDQELAISIPASFLHPSFHVQTEYMGQASACYRLSQSPPKAMRQLQHPGHP
ncbi:hypothetical protein VNO77_33992 [Canavalia gladiata]|uniref:Uncharacterized protein n=1 Tax=Canavalia gladiata TaxID=3824 RepID=A0AAN9KCX3_CANGL